MIEKDQDTRVKRITVTDCMECGKEFEVNDRAKEHKFCSMSCRKKWNRKNKGTFYLRKKSQKIKN